MSSLRQKAVHGVSKRRLVQGRGQLTLDQIVQQGQRGGQALSACLIQQDTVQNVLWSASRASLLRKLEEHGCTSVGAEIILSADRQQLFLYRDLVHAPDMGGFLEGNVERVKNRDQTCNVATGSTVDFMALAMLPLTVAVAVEGPDLANFGDIAARTPGSTVRRRAGGASPTTIAHIIGESGGAEWSGRFGRDDVSLLVERDGHKANVILLHLAD